MLPQLILAFFILMFAMLRAAWIYCDNIRRLNDEAAERLERIRLLNRKAGRVWLPGAHDELTVSRYLNKK